MTDTHRHEWARVGDDWEYAFYCAGCDDYMTDVEVVRRLNAVEHLSAETAIIASQYIYDGTGLDQTSQVNFDYWIGQLRNYADVLEGKDDEDRES